jgi:hypothetical protein
MNLKTLVLFGIFFTSTFYAYSQTTVESNGNPKWDVGLEGMMGVAVGKDFYAFNVGGPTLMLRLNNDWKIGVGALPSFYIKEGKTGAKLGVSPRIDFRNFALIAPFFHFESTHKWVWTVGLGYKFHPIKKIRE